MLSIIAKLRKVAQYLNEQYYYTTSKEVSMCADFLQGLAQSDVPAHDSMGSRASFTAADVFPVKLMQSMSALRFAKMHKIAPLHVQLIPTNKCNLRCDFCSCCNEDRSLEMSYEDVTKVLAHMTALGTESVTITGGGEPLMYPYIEDMISTLHAVNIRVGLVTNGLLLHKIDPKVLNLLTWCRISHGDDRPIMDNAYAANLANVVHKSPDVGWAFSYVVSPIPNERSIVTAIRLADELNFTHIRLVADLFQPAAVPMSKLQSYAKLTLNESQYERVIFQARVSPERGNGDCFIGYLKPVISPDMKVYACCRVQYALAEPSKKLPEELCMGTVDDLPALLNRSSVPFSGARHCVRCYYGQYNRALAALIAKTEHEEFL